MHALRLLPGTILAGLDRFSDRFGAWERAAGNPTGRAPR